MHILTDTSEPHMLFENEFYYLLKLPPQVNPTSPMFSLQNSISKLSLDT
jgi:hypothetical protein